MKPWEQFEQRCYEYLKKLYTTKSTDFKHEGGTDSTKSDIAVIKNGKTDFYIEVKDATAQSGQFVLLPDESREKFVFSPRNRSLPNQMTNIIIEYMNKNFQRFNNAGTAGQHLNIDSAVFAKWIVEYYKNKHVKYIISYNNEYIIFPICKFEQYFNVTACYRIKKSGSREPAKKDIHDIKEIIKEHYTTAKFSQKEKKLFVDLSEKVCKDKFVCEKYIYCLSKQNSGCYEVRKLSNTYNMNVIFAIKLIKNQDKNDLEEFKSDI